MLDLTRHGHVGGGHASHTGELGHGRVAGVHLWVSAHRVHSVGGRVGIASGRGRVDIPHHPVTGGHHGGQRFRQLLLLFAIFCTSVLEPNLWGEKGMHILYIMYGK